MKKILILGGYGGFGARLSGLLAERGHHILVAGRSQLKAEKFCQKIKNGQALQMDRNGDIQQAITQYQPNLIIDAAGPFQGSSYRVAEHSIASAIPYLDLADGRAFVCGIGKLDDAAIAAGVPVISGASSVPALSGAVIRHLASETEHVEAIEMAISASNKATVGSSVSKAILSYVGKPIRVRRAGHWDTGYGWQDIRSIDFDVNDTPGIGLRLVALADVPDLELVPRQFENMPSVSFRAGTELAFQNLGLWMASWPVRWGWIKSLEPAAKFLLSFQNITRVLGSDISGMKVSLFGHRAGKPCRKSWTLIAQKGDGPQIPTFAAVILAEKILRGQLKPGAYDASQLLTLSEFQSLFDCHAITHETVFRETAPSLYRRVMGCDFEQLPGSLQQLHTVLRDGGFRGEAQVTRGKNPLSRLIATIFGFPSVGKHDLQVHIKVDGKGERWTRRFSGKNFTSHLRKSGRFLTENFGPLQFQFALPVTDSRLTMVMTGWKFWCLPLPLFLAPRSEASEWEESERFHFDVPITLPLVGLMVHYRGWLEPC